MNEDRVFAKCAARLIPFMMAMYVVNYIDRVNAGFAALTMNAELGFSPTAYGFGAGLFFVGYLLFQLPASIVLPPLGVRRAVFAILSIWGAISAATALIHSPAAFASLRFCLGAAEAGFFPTMMLYAARWFPRSYRTRFTAMFMTSIPLASMIAGPLSGAILGMDRTVGLSGWQWLFLLEGLPACLLGIVVFRMLPEGPMDASWLSAQEKRVITERVAAEDVATHREIVPALSDYRLFALAAVNFSILFGIYGVQLWQPQIVKAMGFSNLETGFVTAAPFAASLPVMLLVGRSSDARDERVWHIAVPAFVAAIAFAAASVTTGLLSLLAIGVALVGLVSMQPALFSLVSSFLSGRAVAGGTALVISLSNVGSLLGPGLVGVIREQTGGYGTAMAMFAIVLILGALLVLWVGQAIAPRADRIARPA